MLRTSLNAFPTCIAQYEEKTAKLKADVPQLEAIISKTWGKEGELKQLKSVIQCRQVCRVFRLDIPEFDNLQ